jgi:hypothetical protein
MKKVIIAVLLIISSSLLYSQYKLQSSEFGGATICSGGSYILKGTLSQPLVGSNSGTGYNLKSGFRSTYVAVPNVYVGNEYNSTNSGINWQFTEYNDIDLALQRTYTDGNGVINVSGFTHTGDLKLEPFSVIIGDEDFVLNGSITSGAVQTPHSGKLRLSAHSDGSTTYPLSDGTNNYSIKIMPSSGAHDVDVKITQTDDLPSEKQNSEGMLSNMVFEISGANDLGAELVFTIPDASLVGGTLPENVVFRFWNGTRYKAISAEYVTVVDNGTSYTVTITNVNQF